MKGLLIGLMTGLLSFSVIGADPLQNAVDSPSRSESFVLRDQFRHPLQTLQLFDVQPQMTVVEIWPGAGWYTEILAPLLKEQGVLYAAHFPQSDKIPYFSRVKQGFEEKLEATPDVYGNVKLAVFSPGESVLSVPEGSADRVLTFRNVHNWLRDNSEKQAFDLFYKALKPGGVLGVVEHRSLPGIDREQMLVSGYMDEAYVIALAEQAGFVLDKKAEINANPKDSKVHPKGVWTLPPSLRLGDEQRQQYLDIGESDRMTLRFIKPVPQDHD